MQALKTPDNIAAGQLIDRCLITYRMVAPCDNCGKPAAPVHMPRQEHGLYCGACCPACAPCRGGTRPPQS